MSLTPYATLEMGDTNLHYGLALAYSYKMTRKTDSASAPTTTSETTGGNTLTLSPYIEAVVGPGLLSGTIQFSSIDKSTTTDAGVPTDTSSSTSTFAAVNYSYEFNPEFSLIGHLGYINSTQPATATLDKIDIALMAYGVSGRFTF